MAAGSITSNQRQAFNFWKLPSYFGFPAQWMNATSLLQGKLPLAFTRINFRLCFLFIRTVAFIQFLFVLGNWYHSAMVCRLKAYSYFFLKSDLPSGLAQALKICLVIERQQFGSRSYFTRNSREGIQKFSQNLTIHHI